MSVCVRRAYIWLHPKTRAKRCSLIARLCRAIPTLRGGSDRRDDSHGCTEWVFCWSTQCSDTKLVWFIDRSVDDAPRTHRDGGATCYPTLHTYFLSNLLERVLYSGQHVQVQYLKVQTDVCHSITTPFLAYTDTGAAAAR